MKKLLRKTVIVGLVVAGLGLAVSALGYWQGADAAAALDHDWRWSFGVAGADGSGPPPEVYAEPRPIRQEWPTMDAVDIRVVDEDISFVAEGETVVLEYSERHKGQYRVNMDGGTLYFSRIPERKRGLGRLFLNLRGWLRHDGSRRQRPAAGRVRLAVPAGVVLREAAVNTVSGDIEGVDLAAAEVQINTVSGDVRLERFAVDTLRVNGVSGDTTLIPVAEDRARTVTELGRTSAELQRVTAMVLHTVSGNIALQLERPEEYRIDYTGVSGRLFMPGQTFSRRAQLNGAARSLIDITTVSGNATLRAAEPTSTAPGSTSF